MRKSLSRNLARSLMSGSVSESTSMALASGSTNAPPRGFGLESLSLTLSGMFGGRSPRFKNIAATIVDMRWVALLLLLSVAVAWDGDTHRAIGGELCGALQCGQCSNELLNGSTAPDLIFHDNTKHHCYYSAWECAEGNWSCPVANDCPAMALAEEWVAKSRNATGCEKYYDIGVAAHYFFDSKVFWHRVQKEDSDWHSGWEEGVGKAYARGFTYCKYGVCTNWTEFDAWKGEFNTMLGGSGCLSDAECEDRCEAGKCVSVAPWQGLLETLINLINGIFGRWL